MNNYIEGRIDQFERYYNSISKAQQLEILRDYTGGMISGILGIRNGREHASALAVFLVESGMMKIGINTFEQLVDEVENFLEKRKTKLYPLWQRNILAYTKRRTRNRRG